MIRALYTAASGMAAQQANIDTVANNLANVNTAGFKKSRMEFQDLVYQQITVPGSDTSTSADVAPVGLEIGLGTRPIATARDFSTGNLKATNGPLDIGLQGAGFFQITMPSGETGYTRAGAFSFDASGTLISPDGQRVQGYMALDPITKQVITSGTPSDIVVPPSILRPPVATTQFTAISNLNAQAAVGDTFTSSVQIYDSLGAPHVATMTYTNTAPGASVRVSMEKPVMGASGAPSPRLSAAATSSSHCQRGSVIGFFSLSAHRGRRRGPRTG